MCVCVCVCMCGWVQTCVAANQDINCSGTFQFKNVRILMHEMKKLLSTYIHVCSVCSYM